MANIKSGQEIPCIICGEIFYRRRSYIQRGIRKTCGKPECKSASMSGVNNPFYGKVHDEETRIKIRAGRRARPPKGKTGPPKGYKHSPEARAKIKEALLKRWSENRDVMLAQLPRGIDHHFHTEPEERRYRKEWTPLQRKEWMGTECIWCKSTERLTLDHIIPVMDGGTPEQANAQTLCHPCNLWKSTFVDKPRYIAALRCKGGRF